MLGRKSIRVNGADCGLEAIMVGVVTSLGGFLFGYDTGQISGMLLFKDFNARFGQLQSDGSYALNPTIQSLVVSLMSIGTLFGSLTASFTADWFGRRKSLSFGVIIFIIGNIIQITAMESWVHMMMGRFAAGLGVGNLSVGVPMFQGECSPRQIRGAVVSSYQLMITLGILVSNLVNYGVRNIDTSDASWRAVIGIGIGFSIPLGVGALFLPESPRWLATRSNWEGARQSLARLRGVADDPHNQQVQHDLNEMRELLQKEREVGVGTWLECFIPQNTGVVKQVYRTFLGMTLQFLQQWTGTNFFFYYGATIFQSAGIDDPIMVQLILGAVNVAMTFPGLYFVEKFGRRWPMIIGGFWQCAWMIVFASAGVAMDPVNDSRAGILMIVAACMFIASFASTWGPFCWVIVAESFPLRTRAKQASVATAANWLGNFLISFLTPYANDGIGFSYGYVFAGCNIAGAIITYFFLYESAGLTLENVDIMYGEPGLKPWKSKSWLPPGYSSRDDRDEPAPKTAGSDDGYGEKKDTGAGEQPGIEYKA